MARKNKTDEVIKEFVYDTFSHDKTVERYTDDTIKIGLWESEKEMIKKHFKVSDSILDLGCGTGRTTFGLHQMGYKNVIGVDLIPSMVENAIKNNRAFGSDISFEVGDAMNLRFENEQFDACLFSFNGIMQIPLQKNRIIAMKEIHRVLKKGGIFLFTTHDREINEEWFPFWEDEKKKWDKGEQDPRLFEFGDRIVEEKYRLVYLHFPNQKEMKEAMKESGFHLIETIPSTDVAKEPEHILERISPCRFWVFRK